MNSHLYWDICFSVQIAGVGAVDKKLQYTASSCSHFIYNEMNGSFTMRVLMIIMILMMMACEEENNNPLKSDPELEGRFSVLSVTYYPPDPPTESKATDVRVSFANWGETIYDRSIYIQVALIDFNNQRYISGLTLPGIQGGGAITRFEITIWGVDHQQVNLYEVAFTYN